MDEAAIRAELAEIRAQQRALSERAAQLKRQLAYPHVVPVLVFFRHGSRYEDEYRVVGHDAEHEDCSLLEQAYRQLAYGLDNGELSPVGVSVGGHLHSFEDLEKQFGEVA